MKTILVDYTKQDGTIGKDFTFDNKTVEKLMKSGFEKGICPSQFSKIDYVNDFKIWLYAAEGNNYTMEVQVKKYPSSKSLLKVWNSNLTRLTKLITKIEKILGVNNAT